MIRFSAGFFIVLFSTSLWARINADVGSAKHQAPSTSSVVQQRYSGGCHPFVQELHERDQEDLSAGLAKSMAKSCKAGTELLDTKKVFGGDEKYVKFLSERFAYLGKENAFNASHCPKESPRGDLASKYYYQLDKVASLQKAAAAQVLSIDMALGDRDSIQGLKCTESGFPEVSEICKQAKLCPKKSELGNLAKSTKEKLEKIKDLETQVANNAQKYQDHRLSKDEKSKIYQKNGHLQLAIQELKASMPWVEGKSFQVYRKNGFDYEHAIKKQLELDRKEAISNFQLAKATQRCLQANPNKTDACDMQSIKKLALRTEGLQPAWQQAAGKGGTKKQLDAFDTEMKAQDCLAKSKLEQMELSKDLNYAALDGALAVGTMGLSTSSMAAKMIATRAAASQARATRLALGTERAGARGTRAAEWGGFGKDFSAAISHCQELGTEAQSPSSQNRCQIESIYLRSEASENYSRCLVGILEQGLPGRGAKPNTAMAKLNELDRIEAERAIGKLFDGRNFSKDGLKAAEGQANKYYNEKWGNFTEYAKLTDSEAAKLRELYKANEHLPYLVTHAVSNGFDPSKGARMLEKLSRANGGKVDEFISAIDQEISLRGKAIDLDRGQYAVYKLKVMRNKLVNDHLEAKYPNKYGELDTAKLQKEGDALDRRLFEENQKEFDELTEAHNRAKKKGYEVPGLIREYN